MTLTHVQKELSFVLSVAIGAVLLFIGVALLSVPIALMVSGALVPGLAVVLLKADFSPEPEDIE